MLGLSLGGALGGGSGIGGLIGSAGGLAGGLLGSALLSGSLTGATTGGIFAGGGLLGLSAIGGITLAAAPLLLLGGWLLGRNKQRRADEQTRNQLSLDSFKQIEDLIKQVNLDEIDGQNALAQANGVRENYLSQANALKDKKTRKIAVKDVSRVDSRISTLRSAVAAQEQRQEIGRNLSAEFHTGGILNASGGRFAGALPRNFSGRIPGSFDRKDDLLMAVSRGETAIVLTPDQWQQTAPFIAPVLKNANVPGFREGGVRQIAAPPIGSKNPQRNGTVEVGNLTVELHGNYDPETIVVKGLRSDKAGKIVVGHVRTEMIDG